MSQWKHLQHEIQARKLSNLHDGRCQWCTVVDNQHRQQRIHHSVMQGKITNDTARRPWDTHQHTNEYSIIIIIIINEFHRDASLTKTSGPLCVTCFTSVNGTVAGSVRCRMMYVTADQHNIQTQDIQRSNTGDKAESTWMMMAIKEIMMFMIWSTSIWRMKSSIQLHLRCRQHLGE